MSNGGRLLYREDAAGVRGRLSRWWNGEWMERPAMLLTCPASRSLEPIPEIPAPAGWITDYSIKDFGYRVNIALRGVASKEYFAEALPCAAPHLAPNCLALFLGCEGRESPGTVWCEPFIHEPEGAGFKLDPSNKYWDFSLRLGREFARLGRGKFLVEFPDLIEGLDTLAAMRGSQELLVDLLDRPEWVKECLARLTPLYFDVYDRLYGEYRDDAGGSIYWLWAPGRVAKLQCDFSAMISADMFGEFMLPVLREMCSRLDYSLYHWDGPGALQHLDHLLSLDDLDMIQWTPGSGIEPPWDRRWWPYLHRIADSGRRIFIWVPGAAGAIRALKQEFGEGFRQFLLSVQARDKAHAEELLRAAEL